MLGNYKYRRCTYRNLGSRENILKAKLEITDGMIKNSTLVLNGDEDLLYNKKGL
jgi:UDP-N-acetylmuramoyl-tripeptide--D-alanyl-D-alanine ligase